MAGHTACMGGGVEWGTTGIAPWRAPSHLQFYHLRTRIDGGVEPKTAVRGRSGPIAEPTLPWQPVDFWTRGTDSDGSHQSEGTTCRALECHFIYAKDGGLRRDEAKATGSSRMGRKLAWQAKVGRIFSCLGGACDFHCVKHGLNPRRSARKETILRQSYSVSGADRRATLSYFQILRIQGRVRAIAVRRLLPRRYATPADRQFLALASGSSHGHRGSRSTARGLGLQRAHSVCMPRRQDGRAHFPELDRPAPARARVPAFRRALVSAPRRRAGYLHKYLCRKSFLPGVSGELEAEVLPTAPNMPRQVGECSVVSPPVRWYLSGYYT